ncbi:MAG TPA: NADH-quinone oxidoreductase subunit N [Nocardioidaceae bacterium]|nr:NADH-quinone oxidoreductase subunit N [Nocardioidaceae bacterium]
MSTVQAIDWAATAPLLAVAVTAVVVLVVDAFTHHPRWAGLLSVLGLAVATVSVLPLVGDDRATFCLPDGRGCSFVVDELTIGFWVVVLAGTLLTVMLSAVGAIDDRVPTGEHHFLLLCSAAGALAIAGARDLATLVIALELVSLPAFALVGLKRGDRRSAEAALKFFLVSVVATAVMLYGISLVYGVTGSMHVGGIRAALADGAEPAGVLAIGVVLSLFGLLFKVAAVPLHGWVPDTYVGAPPAVAAYLSVVSKAAGFVALLVLLSRAFGEYGEVWGPILAAVAALTMTVGNVLALRQRHAVRLLAWSSVGQSGFMLAPLAVVADGRAEVSGAAAEAVLAYLLIYSVVNLGAFAVVAAVSRHRPAGAISDYQGLVRRQPWAGVGLAFALLCLAGLPPGIAGLFAKVVVFESVVTGGLGWLAVVMAVNVAIGLAYYVRWMAVVLGPVGEDSASPEVHPAVAAAIGATLVAAIGLSVVPSAVLGLLG